MKPKNEATEAFRYRMYKRGYMNKTELAAFMDCGYINATKAWNAMLTDASRKGIEQLKGVILTRRVMQYLGLTEDQIINDYERQKKETAQQS